MRPSKSKQRILSAKNSQERINPPFIKAERVVKRRNVYETMRIPKISQEVNNETDNDDNSLKYNTLNDYFKNRELNLLQGTDTNRTVSSKRQI